MESLVDRLRAHLESPEGKAATIAYFKKIEDEEKRIEDRAMQVIKSIKDLSDEEIHQKLVDFLAWEEKYEEMWYSRCVQTSSRAFGVLIYPYALIYLKDQLLFEISLYITRFRSRRNF